MRARPHFCDVRNWTARQGVVLSPVMAGRGKSGFAFSLRLRSSSYAVTRRRDTIRPSFARSNSGLPGRSSRPASGIYGDARLRFQLRRGRLQSRPTVENEAWWVARGSHSPTAAICGRGRGSPAIDHSLTAGRSRARRARATRDHRIKSPINGLFTTIYVNYAQHSATR